jgi:hypothetical protein
LYPFKETEDVSVDEPISDKDENVEWKEQLPREAQKEIEEVLMLDHVVIDANGLID